jgi:hypothetical protein
MNIPPSKEESSYTYSLSVGGKLCLHKSIITNRRNRRIENLSYQTDQIEDIPAVRGRRCHGPLKQAGELC